MHSCIRFDGPILQITENQALGRLSVARYCPWNRFDSIRREYHKRPSAGGYRAKFRAPAGASMSGAAFAFRTSAWLRTLTGAGNGGGHACGKRSQGTMAVTETGHPVRMRGERFYNLKRYVPFNQELGFNLHNVIL